MAPPLRRGLIAASAAAALAAGGCRLLGGEGPRVPLFGADPDRRAVFDRARASLAEGRIEEALLDLRRLRVEFPGEAAVPRAIQEALVAAGEVEEARAEARAELERERSPSALVLAARVALSSEEAESTLAEALALDRRDAGARHGLARLRLARAREAGTSLPDEKRHELEEEGRRAIEALVRDDPGYLPARADRAALFVRAGDRGAAIRELQALLDSDPGDAASRLALGLLDLEEDRAPEAGREFDRLLAARPFDAEALFGLAAAEAAQERAREALAAIERALALDPGDPRGLLSLGILRRQRLGDPEGAAEALRACLASPRAALTLSIFERLRARLLLEKIEAPTTSAPASRPQE
ncbi:MAG TPA: tetratricopeptide repeat protein [Planctomycetota bacterium]|nr:tetratricopeptide repeat protein [Planctomycetota bacterium]